MHIAHRNTMQDCVHQNDKHIRRYTRIHARSWQNVQYGTVAVDVVVKVSKFKL